MMQHIWLYMDGGVHETAITGWPLQALHCTTIKECNHSSCQIEGLTVSLLIACPSSSSSALMHYHDAVSQNNAIDKLPLQRAYMLSLQAGFALQKFI